MRVPKYLLCIFLILSAVCAEEEPAAASTDDDGEGAEANVFDAKQLETINAGSDKKEFQAEVNRLMEIIIHSLYTNRNIFLRELISNAGDALDKIRYESLLDKDVLGENKDLDIKLRADKKAGTISICDSGIGMTAEEMDSNLGTVARSGTAHFLEKMAKVKDDKQKALDLIGQFGVGFYSAFLVADEVTVVSKSNSGDQAVWISKADGQFRVSKDPRGNTLTRGTCVVLKMKEDAQEYLELSEIESIVKKYSEFIQYPIKMWKSNTKTVEVEEEKKEKKEKDDDDEEEDDDDELEAKDEEEDKETKTVEKTVWEWQILNENKPLWTRRPSEVKDEEYIEFYKTFEKSTDEPLSWTHFRAEGEIEFDSLLYIPKTAPSGMYDNYYTSSSKLKLYVRRVLVADEWKEFMPRYLGFVKGMVDSNDLPLNVNREQLQKNKIMKVISKKVTRKCLDMLRQLAESEEDKDDDDDDDEDKEKKDKEDEEEDEGEKDDKPKKYVEFWKQFGRSIKLGIIEDAKNRKKLLNLLRFTSTASKTDAISLQSYVDRMKDGQKHIYFISAASQSEAEKSPMLESVTAKGYEVLFFIENLDEYMNLSEYDDYQLQSVSKEGLELDASKKKKKYLEDKAEEFEELRDWLKEQYGDKITKVEVSQRLESTPMAIVTSKYGVSANMERLNKGQAFGADSQTATKILEINFRHPIIKSMKTKAKENPKDQSLIDLASLLYDSAAVASGFTIDGSEADKFKVRVDRIVRSGLGVEADAKVDELPEFGADEAEDDDDDDDSDDDDDDDEEEEEEEEEEAGDDKAEEDAEGDKKEL